MVFAKAAAHTSQTNFNRTMKRGEEGVSVPRPPLSLCLMRARLPLRVYDCVCDRPVPLRCLDTFRASYYTHTHTLRSLFPSASVPMCVSGLLSVLRFPEIYRSECRKHIKSVCVCVQPCLSRSKTKFDIRPGTQDFGR